MRRLFSDKEFNEKLNKKYEIMAQKAINSRGGNSDYWNNDNDKLAVERRRDAALAIGQQAIDAKKEDEWKRRMDLSRYGANDPLVREGMPNASRLDQIREENAGELARKQLGLDFNREELEFNKRKLDVENIRDYYKTDVGAKSAKYTGDSERIKAAAAIGGDMTLPIEQRQPFIDFLKSYATPGTQKQGEGAGTPTARPTLTEEVPAAVPATQTAKRPAGTYDDGKDNPVTPTVSTGGKSMEFRQEGIISPEQYELNKKKSRERLLYGTKPQQKSWFGF